MSAIAAATTSSYSIRNGRVRGVTPPVWVQTIAAPCSAATSTSSGSAPPHASLSRSAPAAHAAAPTSARQVSTEITSEGYDARTRATKSTTRAFSSAAEISSPGAALIPPMSTISAPCSTTVATRSNAASSTQVAPWS